MPAIAEPIKELMEMRRFVENGHTKSYEFRRAQLLALRDAMRRYEERIYGTLNEDLRKSPEEAYATEVGMVLMEIRIALKHLRQWMEPEAVRTNLLNFPSSSRILRDPLGVVLIVAPWNYPIQLLLLPLVGAIAAGNAVLLKPSELAPACAGLMEELIRETFPPHYVSIVCGEGASIIPRLMQEFRFDHVFFTGSTAVGGSIYRLAAEKLVPVTLELGGKNPVVVERDADIKVAAKRIALGKFLNAGQTCAAPDYLLVHSAIKEAFVAELMRSIDDFFGGDPMQSRSYGRIISEERFTKLSSYLKEGRIISGGRLAAEDRFIAPTIMDGVSLESSLMKEEIFGPILPVFGFDETEEARAMIARYPSPLSFYVFTRSATLERSWLNGVRFGGGCVNNTLWQLSNHHLPFGGIGLSGIGSYHGKRSFELFTHCKPVMSTPLWFDLAIKYPPFGGKLKWFKKMIR